MKPEIDATEFGSITIGGGTYDHDVVIRPGGKVKKRKKKLSKAVYGTSHIVSLDEAKHVYVKHTERVIVGSGQNGVLKLSEEAREYLERKGCRIDVLPTPRAARLWNESTGRVAGLFHVTC